LVGAILLEQNDEWSSVQRSRYMTLESVAPLSADPTVSLLILAR
jgi:putative transposase